MNAAPEQPNDGEEPEKGALRIEMNRPLRIRRTATIVVVAGAMSAAVWILGHFPSVVERAYTERAGYFVGRALGVVSGLFPVSAVEILMIALAFCGVFFSARGVYQVVRRKRSAGNAFVCAVFRLAETAGAIVAFFYLSWGINYARADLVRRTHWESYAEKALGKPDAERLAKLCDELVEASNAEYVRALGVEDLGRPSSPVFAVSHTDAAIESAYVRVTERLKLHPTFAVSRGKAKPVLISPVMSRLLISGFYSPWTGEANYNTEVPACKLSEVIAHEKAHQRGITSEDEANFFGFLACISSEDPYVRYSGYLMAQRQLLPELGNLDGMRAKAIIAKRFKGVQRDADAIRAFIASHRGRVSAVGSAVNNAYLKANRVSAGVKSYQLSAQLILVFVESNGGTCVLGSGR